MVKKIEFRFWTRAIEPSMGAGMTLPQITLEIETEREVSTREEAMMVLEENEILLKVLCRKERIKRGNTGIMGIRYIPTCYLVKPDITIGKEVL